MITREAVKAEIDKVQDEYLETIYRIIQALANPPSELIPEKPQIATSNWHQFIKETYGLLADDPIDRSEQGEFEIREAIA